MTDDVKALVEAWRAEADRLAARDRQTTRGWAIAEERARGYRECADALEAALARVEAAPRVEWVDRGPVEDSIARPPGWVLFAYPPREGGSALWAVRYTGPETGDAATLDEAKAAAERAAGVRS